MWKPSAPSDWSAIIEMCRELNREDPGPAAVPDGHMIRTLEELSLHPLRGRSLVLSVDGRIEGYALLISFWSNELGGEICVMDEIFVRPSHRNQGHGKTLIAALTSRQAIWPRPCVAVDLEVTPRNSRARKLYESLGFKPARNTHMRFRY